ncbi:hypothetical protein [Cylindrospermopsis raciborskii]|uniref:hypothetical protein n=1 Tax=Cylindrospermopsis raciborskii TaxID=77022 RepID=UPI000778E106|nr:hypothetical protein [Cylindrospermopsis raciborskii]
MVIFWILCVLFASVVAGNKGHDGCMWALEGTNQTKVLAIAILEKDDKHAIALGVIPKCARYSLTSRFSREICEHGK